MLGATVEEDGSQITQFFVLHTKLVMGTYHAQCPKDMNLVSKVKGIGAYAQVHPLLDSRIKLASSSSRQQT